MKSTECISNNVRDFNTPETSTAREASGGVKASTARLRCGIILPCYVSVWLKKEEATIYPFSYLFGWFANLFSMRLENEN